MTTTPTQHQINDLNRAIAAANHPAMPRRMRRANSRLLSKKTGIPFARVFHPLSGYRNSTLPITTYSAVNGQVERLRRKAGIVG